MEYTLFNYLLTTSIAPINRTIEYLESSMYWLDWVGWRAECWMMNIVLAELEKWHPGEQPDHIDVIGQTAIQKLASYGYSGSSFHHSFKIIFPYSSSTIHFNPSNLIQSNLI